MQDGEHARESTAGAEAERLKRDNDAQHAAAQAELDRAVKEKAALRAQLLQQFNIVLQTRDTARGLIVNMSDVLFDTGRFTLRPVAREKLTKVAGIVAGHPGLRLDVEGHTDSVGGDEYNQRLSEQRGGAVRDYLTQEGMAATSVTAKGSGKDKPVATNDTASGRQQNRRVELMISGDIIWHGDWRGDHNPLIGGLMQTRGPALGAWPPQPRLCPVSNGVDWPLGLLTFVRMGL